MPPVRWKILYVTIAIFLQLWTKTYAQHMQEAISMTADGWRPIVGSRKPSPAFSQDSTISQYKNPSQKYEVEIVKSENPVAVSSTVAPDEFTGKPRDSSTNSINKIKAGSQYTHNQGGKIPPHTKITSPGYHTLPTIQHGQQVPVGAVTQGRPSQFGFRKHPVKPPVQYATPPNRKPLRGPLGAHSNRNEVYVHPPTTVNLPFHKQGLNNVKTRETQGLKLAGNHFTVNQPNSHIEVNRFPHPPTNDNAFEQIKSHPVFFQKLKDDYTRNLVPPPPSRFLIEKEKLKAPKLPAKFKDNVATVSEPVLEFHDVGLQQFGGKSPQDNLVQLSFPFGQPLQLQNQFAHSEQPVNVEVTKEQLKVFHNNVPARFHPQQQDYVDYFHTVSTPAQVPKLQTYEVTEGKWIDNPNPYSFKFQQTQEVPHKVRKPTGPARPLIPEPLVELSLPPFLPTPYRPPGALPTSATQSEASTVFSQVSTKVNKYKGEALTKNPLFFDLKEVSTHYPILGKPEFISESETDTPTAMGGNAEISNEITTQRPKKRRRPQPRRPSTTVATTTTTEEPTTTDDFNFRKQNNFEPTYSEETERPYRRQRPRPNRIRTGTTGSGGYESEERPLRYRTPPPPKENEEREERKPVRYRTTSPPIGMDDREERKPVRYRTTPPSRTNDEEEEKRIRGRHRYRQRVPVGTKDSNEPPSSHHRKRIRTTTEMPVNHKIADEDQPLVPEDMSALAEETGESNEPNMEEEATTLKPYRFEYEPSVRQQISSQYQEESRVRYETTPSSREHMNNRAAVMIEEVTEKEDQYDRVEEVGSSTTEISIMEINLPENEIDYASSSGASEQHENEYVQTTLATTTPSTTTTTTEAPTTKSVKTRTRPIKYHSSNRPRFSVKEYRQRLNQYTSTTPSTTTDFVKTTSEVTRVRFPNRFKTRPPLNTSPPPLNYEEETNTDQMQRRKFKPKDPRHSTTTTESVDAITESSIKSMKTRLRPFGRYTNSTRIKSNLFSTRRKGLVSMKTKLFSKPADTEETIMTSEEPTEAVTTPTTKPEEESLPAETVTEFHSDTMNIVEATGEVVPPTVEAVINDDDYSQRVSDLTSSFKSEYDTPGLFKSVSPNSRRVPNYFTISTDDPILPIEAFFPNIKDKEQ
nr:uncharacterized protein LOC111508986 [Leptinotarsa decemlineata]XP_023020418.1 uncharacterized protein LOC111508986 [Leptinotarsa decemlineata]